MALSTAALLAAACSAEPGGPVAGTGQPGATPGRPASQAAPVATTDLVAIRDAIWAQYQDKLLGIGYGADAVGVEFQATASDAAADVVARYGSAVQVTVGFFPYPPPASPPIGCTWPVATIVDPGPLRATIELATTDLTHAAAFSGKVRLTNTGTSPVSVTTGQPLEIYLFRSGESTPIGGSPGAIAGVGLGPTLKPAGSFEIEAGGGTASCDLSLGYELPNGPYVARAAVELDQPNSTVGYFWSEPLAVELRSSP